MKQFLHFQSGVGKRLVPVDDVVEVIPMVALQRDDETYGQHFCGLMNYRGHIVPVFTLSQYASEDCSNIDYFLIVAGMGDAMVAVLAQEVDYLVTVEAGDITTVRPREGQPFMVAKINEEMVKVVNPQDFLQ